MKTAWLITWDWCGDHAKPERELVSILNYRLSGDRVKEYVEQMYADLMYSLNEKLMIAKNRRKNPYKAEFGSIGRIPYSGEIMCGHNPWLYARIVKNIRVEKSDNGEEVLKWDEFKPELPEHIIEQFNVKFK